jgi:hypothetical protein
LTGKETMITKTIPWDAAKCLETPAGQNEFLRESVVSGDPAEIREAIDIVAQARAATKQWSKNEC